jgi:hypothetical protein
MKPCTCIGVQGGDFFVQLDPQTGFVRRDDITFLPTDRLFENLGMKAAPG